MTTVIDPVPLEGSAAAAGTPANRFITLTTAAALAALETDCEQLFAAAASPMQSFAWIEAAATAIGGGRLQIVCLRRGERIAAVAPLVRFSTSFGGAWELLNLAKLHEPADLVYQDEAALDELAVELARRGLPVLLGRLPADSPTIEAVRRAYGRRGWIACRPQASTPYIPLDASWATPENNISSRRRSDVRRSRRHAEELGQVSTEILSPSPNEVDELLDLAFDVECRSWKGEQGTALARDATRGEFYRRYARHAARAGSLRLGFLHVGDQTAAMQISVVRAGALWVLKVGYDPRFQRASPGILLMVEQIKRAVAEGLQCYELLGTVEPWIQVWTERERACVSLRAYPANFRGMAALASDAAGAGRQRWQRRPAMRNLAAPLRRAASKCLTPLAARAARAYIAGPELADALRLSRRLAERNFSATVGFWDGAGDSPREVADQYLAALDAIADARLDAYLSIKFPALGSSKVLLDEVLARARRHRVRIHFDSLGPETADEAWAALSAASGDPSLDLSCSLPGRWRRSLDDAEQAIACGIAVRVVKGQWPDPSCPAIDLREGFLQLIDRLAGRARHVAAASHDVELASEALRRLKSAGTSSELELLYGLPERRSLRFAQRDGAPVRFYVPYGKAYLPYCVAQAKRQPRLLLWLLRDSLSGQGQREL
ncbi:MAG TPA: GNAT family N-acetyltransferase [Pirellulales bacterium]|nr:GNAT family N-acetyltransferase [Pirellulales bacterium]